MSEVKYNLSTSGSAKVPRFLQPYPNSGENPNRGNLPVDSLDGEGTALDTVRKRPSYKTKVFKQVSRKLAEAEEWVDFLNKKQSRIPLEN